MARMSLTAPYTNAMRIGQGFNTYTQEIRLDNAVLMRKKATTSSSVNTPPPSPQPQPASLAVPETANATPQAPPDPRPITPPQEESRPESSSGQVKSETSSMTAGRSMGKSSAKVSLSRETAFSRPAGGSVPSATMLLDPGAAVSPENVPFVIPAGPPEFTDQSVTYSTRAIENVSDIMDALNISTAMSIKFGTIHGNGSAAFVNENKVLDSQLNYVVSVNVNNDALADPEEMEFQPIDGLPPDRFTEVYGDCFLSGFLEGGSFNAVISIQVHDKSKLKAVKQAVDLQLAIGPSPVDIGAKEEFGKNSSEVLQDTEITISVNWVGGGDIKKPEVPWTLASVVAVANAFPSMVARCSARTSAILTRYESLRSFQSWKWSKITKDTQWGQDFRILNYTPCTVYTADLFDALMQYKKLWKTIGDILQNPSSFKARELPKNPRLLVDTTKENEIPKRPTLNKFKTVDVASPCDLKASGKYPHGKTFEVEDTRIEEEWDLDVMNYSQEPIPVDPVALNEARLLCREAMTLITEEASRLVDHPHLAYAEFNTGTRKTRMKRPNYAYPEVLRNRLPVRTQNDASDDSWTADDAAMMTRTFARDNDLFCHLVGDVPSPHRTYKSFTSLAMNEGRVAARGAAHNGLQRLSLHGYHHHWLDRSDYDRDAADAIGAIGFSFAADDAQVRSKNADLCTVHVGRPTFHRREAGPPFTALDLLPPTGVNGRGVDITRVDVFYVPGSGRVAGIALYDNFGEAAVERLSWKQWGASGHEPRGLKVVVQRPPEDGARWRFVGLCGDFDATAWGEVLARVSGIWRRT